MTVEVHQAEFLKTATQRAEWPAGSVPEVAFVGRSNVGKSSMLNALAKRRKLARVSGTPGRTRQLQFFELTFRRLRGAAPERLGLCDLPGYGFAKVPKGERDRWATMIEEYLQGRETLCGVVLIVDARHPSTESDQEAYRFLQQTGRPVIVAVTKADKLAKSLRLPAARDAERQLQTKAGSAVLFSAVEKTGTDALWERILALADEFSARV